MSSVSRVWGRCVCCCTTCCYLFPGSGVTVCVSVQHVVTCFQGLGSLCRCMTCCYLFPGSGVAVCVAVQHVVTCFQGLGSLCVSLYDMLLPVIELSTDVRQPPHVYLCEDGLHLWYITLQCSASLTPPLLGLYSNMPRLLGMVYSSGNALINKIKIAKRK